MKNYTNSAIVASFLGLWIASFFSDDLQKISGFALILSFGILHGANDLQLIDKIEVALHNNGSTRILIYYLSFTVLGISLFYLFPLLALFLFIIVSAYHFGEQQWQKLPELFPVWSQVLYQFLYGFVILFLLFVFHEKQVQKVIFSITNFTVPTAYFVALIKISGGALFCLSAYLYWKTIIIRKELALELFHLLVFAIIFKSSSLIWGFAIYFVVWHSIPSIVDQIKFLNGSVTKENFIQYCKKAGVYWFVSLLGIALLYFVFKEEHIFNALFFSFLAAITFPHAIVITQMFRKKNA